MQTAVQLALTVPQPDDSGANTADRYEWQAAMAAAHGLRLYLDALNERGRIEEDEDRRIVCEYHEDWIVAHGDYAELVSGKHRDPEVGAYTTINQLADKGGLTHLFLRWCALKEKPTCKLVTTGALASGDPQDLYAVAKRLRAQRLADQTLSITDEDLALIGGLHAAIRVYGKSHLPADWSGEQALSLSDQKKQTARFLSMLSIAEREVLRMHLSDAAPTKYAKPIVDRLGLDTPPEAVWEAVLAIFRARMRAAGPIPSGGLPSVLEFASSAEAPTAVDRERALAKRIVTMQGIHVAIMIAEENPGAYRVVAPAIRTTRSAVKMAAGKCSENSIERAEQLRRDYRQYWRDRMSGDPTAIAARDKLRRLLLRISDRATPVNPTANSSWGAEFWAELQSAVETVSSDAIPPGLDADILLGGVSDLADMCQIWFSERFDVDATVTRLRESRGTAA